MRYLFTTILTLLLPICQSVGGKGGMGGKAGIGGGVCITPVGTNFTESFGESSTLCWAAGPSSCNHTWTIGAGTPQSIVTSPIGYSTNTACANSLQMVEPNGSAAYLKVSFTGLTAATNYDLQGTLYVSSGISTFGEANLVACFVVSGGVCDASGAIASLFLRNNSGVPQVNGFGSTASSNITIALNTWMTFDLHHDATAANCSLSVNGGTAQTFTCNSGTAADLDIGTAVFGTNAATYLIGNLNF